jgi:hypothetical protein
MISILSYRARKGIFQLGFALTIVGSFYLTFNHYFAKELPVAEKGNAGYILREHHNAIDISTHDRSKTNVVTFQTLCAGFHGVFSKCHVTSFITTIFLQKNFSPYFFSYPRKAILLFCKFLI